MTSIYSAHVDTSGTVYYTKTTESRVKGYNRYNSCEMSRVPQHTHLHEAHLEYNALDGTTTIPDAFSYSVSQPRPHHKNPRSSSLTRQIKSQATHLGRMQDSPSMSTGSRYLQILTVPIFVATWLIVHEIRFLIHCLHRA